MFTLISHVDSFILEFGRTIVSDMVYVQNKKSLVNSVDLMKHLVRSFLHLHYFQVLVYNDKKKKKKKM